MNISFANYHWVVYNYWHLTFTCEDEISLNWRNSCWYGDTHKMDCPIGDLITKFQFKLRPRLRSYQLNLAAESQPSSLFPTSYPKTTKVYIVTTRNLSTDRSKSLLIWQVSRSEFRTPDKGRRRDQRLMARVQSTPVPTGSTAQAKRTSASSDSDEEELPPVILDAQQRVGLVLLCVSPVLIWKERIREGIRTRTSYDALPVSFRLILLDTNLLVKKALHCLIQNSNSIKWPT